MKMSGEIGEILLSDPSVFVMIWKRGSGWRVLCGGNLALDAARVEKEGLYGLKQAVTESDQGLCDVWIKKVRDCVEGKDSDAGEMGGYMETAIHLKTADGSPVYDKIECYLQRDAQEMVERVLIRIPELNAEEIYRIHLAKEITNDKNPAFFTQNAKMLLNRHPDWEYALIQFDVAKFKIINEQFGEGYGDEMLEFFIQTLKLLCDKEQMYVRLTADVFMILTPYRTREDLLAFVEKLRENLSGYKGGTYRLVFGICPIRDKSQNLRRYGDGAALARQSIKDDALTHVAFYEESMKQRARMSKFVEDNMERALENHEFVMYLQPKYSISQERIIGAEALVRWVHPEYGIIPPMEFIPLFEKNGFVVKMDRYIWEEACKTIRKWIDAGIEPLPISVNVSRRHLRDHSFVDVLNRLVAQYGISRKYLELEITETIDDGDVKSSIRLLKDSGFLLLMDDFGSGYSSLNMLKDTQFDVIKIDRGFLQDFIASDRGRSIVEHTIRMAKAIGLDLIAEGVETKEQALFLRDCGCDKAQGFYYARPMTLEDFNQRYSGRES